MPWSDLPDPNFRPTSRRGRAWAILSRVVMAAAVLFALALCTVGPGVFGAGR